VVSGNTAPRKALAEVDDAAHRDHGYRTVRIGRAIPVPSNGSIARISMGPGLQAALRQALAGADVVHVQGLVGSRLARNAVAMSEAPVTVGTFHTYVEGENYWLYRLFRSHLDGLLSQLDRRIAVSHACVDSMHLYFPGDYDVIPNGVDCQRFRPLTAGEAPPDGPPRILFVGRLEPRNALADLIRACGRLAAEGREFVIQVAGDGPTRGVNERLARRVGIEDRIEWLGMIHDDLPRRYREATVFAAPCTLASFGVILVEALASGTPIVCADNVGFRQVIRDGAPGRFTPMRDPDELAVAIGAVLDDDALRSDWAERGRRIAEERFDWPGVARAVVDVYRGVAAGKSDRSVVRAARA
jgi:phosphatidylinositol alpha-mannosyltransferase